MVGKNYKLAWTLRMSKHLSLWILFFQLHKFLYRKLLVNMACAVPQFHRASGYGIDIIAEVAVWTKDDRGVFRKTLYNLPRIG